KCREVDTTHPGTHFEPACRKRCLFPTALNGTEQGTIDNCREPKFQGINAGKSAGVLDEIIHLGVDPSAELMENRRRCLDICPTTGICMPSCTYEYTLISQNLATDTGFIKHRIQ